MSGTISGISQGLGAVFLGGTVGIISEKLTQLLWTNRKQIGSAEPEANSFLDYVLDALIQTTFIVLGTALVERASPSISQTLPNMVLFELGLLCAVKRLPADLNAIAIKITSSQAAASLPIDVQLAPSPVN